MSKFYDPFESMRKQQQYLNKIFNPPAMQVMREQQNFVNRMTMKNLTGFGQLNSGLAKLNQNFNNSWYNNSPLMKTLNELQNTHVNFINKFPELNNQIFKDVTATTNSLNLLELFDDITMDSLNVFNEIITDIGESKPNYQEGSSDLESTLTINKPDLVGNMTRSELRVEISQAFREAQSGVSKEMDPKDRIRSFFAGVLTSIGQDVAKQIIIIMFQVLIAIMINIASGNHDYDVAKQVSTKIDENETAKMVKKAFVKNPEIDQPMGELGFLRTESKLRTRPSKKSHLVSKKPVSKNTVIFPVEKKGNWVLVEVETKDEFYIGWVEESKVIKFKLEKNSTNNKD